MINILRAFQNTVASSAHAKILATPRFDSRRFDIRGAQKLATFRRLSAPNSGSLRRRARERLQAENTRIEGELLARERNYHRHRQRLESQRQARLELATYEPWGRLGGGAPNPAGIRFTKIRDEEIIPEDELRGVQLKEGRRYWESSPLHRRRKRQTPMRIREDPQCYYAENLRKSVDNDIRYRRTPAQHREYKAVLDDMVKKKQKALHDEMRKNLEYEQKMHQMATPWGKPGPGGSLWRNPRDIGLNFSKSMGWTDNEILNNMKGDQGYKSSLTLPNVKTDDDSYQRYLKERAQILRSRGEKLPEISQRNSANIVERKKSSELREIRPIESGSVKGKLSGKNKFTKRLSIGDELKRASPFYPADFYEPPIQFEERGSALSFKGDKKPTPEDNILDMTGGIELVPLLARRRRVGARTLPSSDVTRPPEQSCQWRDMIDAEYLKILKQQMLVKCQQQEEKRLDSAESVRRHHATWASLWGRPGHGAPQERGRYARSNLARLLYVSPFTKAQYQNV